MIFEHNFKEYADHKALTKTISETAASVQIICNGQRCQELDDEIVQHLQDLLRSQITNPTARDIAVQLVAVVIPPMIDFAVLQVPEWEAQLKKSCIKCPWLCGTSKA